MAKPKIASTEIRAQRGTRPRREYSDVAVAQPLFAQRAVDSASDGIPEPDDGSEEYEGKHELKCVNHVDSP